MHEKCRLIIKSFCKRAPVRYTIYETYTICEKKKCNNDHFMMKC